MSEAKEASVYQKLSSFCDALSDLLTNSKTVPLAKTQDSELEQHVLSMLDELNKIVKERSLDTMVYFSGSPNTPNSVLPEMTNNNKSAHFFLPIRVQSVGKLNPINVKRLSFHMVPLLATQVHQTVIGKEEEESKEDLKIAQHLIPPSSPSTKSVTAPPAPPPSATVAPSPGKGGGAPPPPPPGSALRLKTTKLKRSSHMGNLYRLLKEMIEGSSLVGGKSSRGRKGKGNGGSYSNGGKTTMADALAEMTKRSPHFQKIEEDVKNYTNIINQMKVQIANFHGKDMTKLVKFHGQIESILEKLTDESKVLSRFDDFPVKKLEAIRMASNLYSKLDGYVNTLRNWKTEPPLNQLLEKSDKYFLKMKVELEAWERRRDEEEGIFQSHKINFDYDILTKIKELMVDISSGCMELAIREIREGKKMGSEKGRTGGLGLKKGNYGGVEEKRGKMVWKAFQFAFRVYTFAGGHDDRANKLTRELAIEIQDQHGNSK